MTRGNSISIGERFRLADCGDVIAHTEPLGGRVFLSRSCAAQRHAWIGVPATRGDILIDERILAGVESADPRDVIVLEIGRKSGRYDGAERDRLTLRLVHGHDAEGYPLGRIDIDIDPSAAPHGSVAVAVSTGAGIAWERSYQRERVELHDGDGYALPQILMWHAYRYFGCARSGEDPTGPLGDHLDDVVALAESGAWLTWPDGSTMIGADGRALATLAAANRAAERALYRLARDYGWRKLTARERARLQLDGPQWVAEEVYARAQAAMCDLDHVGDATRRAAGGLGLGIDEVEIVRRGWAS